MFSPSTSGGGRTVSAFRGAAVGSAVLSFAPGFVFEGFLIMTAYHPAPDSPSFSRPYVRGERVVLPSSGEILVGPDPLLASRPHGSVSVYDAGCVVRRRSLPSSAPVGGVRGVVSGFSDASRRRLRLRLIRVGWSDYLSDSKRSASARALFVTLTYPASFPPDPPVWKSHLKSLRQRLERSVHFRPAGVIWKLEFQLRGAVHFHLVVFFPAVVDVRLFRSWLSRAWYAVVGSGDMRHLRRGVHCIPLYGSPQGVVRYLAKYVSKGLDLPDYLAPGASTGRVWGVWWVLPDGKIAFVSFPGRADWFNWLRRFRRWRLWDRVYAINYCDGVRLLQLMRGFVVLLDGDYFQVS